MVAESYWGRRSGAERHRVREEKNTDTTCIMLSVILLTTWDSLTFTQASAAESLICRESRLVRVTEFFAFTVNYLTYLFSSFEWWQNIEQECWTQLKYEIKRCSDNEEKKHSQEQKGRKNSTDNWIRSHPKQKDRTRGKRKKKKTKKKHITKNQHDNSKTEQLRIRQSKRHMHSRIVLHEQWPPVVMSFTICQIQCSRPRVVFLCLYNVVLLFKDTGKKWSVGTGGDRLQANKSRVALNDVFYSFVACDSWACTSHLAK